MADISLSNKSSVSGTYDTSVITLESNMVTTSIVDDLTVEKTVDKQKWVNGELTYTITITNNADNIFEAPVLIDVLNPELIKLVDNSVQVNGNEIQYSYVEANGTLSVNLEDIAVGGASVVTFRVQRK